MPGLNSTEVRVAGTGHIYKAPTGTTLPTSSADELDPAFVEVGYAADGFKVAQSLKTKDVTAWQTLSPLRIIVTERDRTFTFTLQQTNAETLQLAWGGATITPGSAGAYTLNIPDDATLAEYSWVIDWEDGDTEGRFVLDRGALTALSSITFGRQDEVSYDITMRPLKPADGSNSVKFFGVDTSVNPPAAG